MRYQDDFLLFHPSKKYLQYCLEQIKIFLANEKLQLNDIKNNNKVNIVSEISKDLINSAPKKYKLEEKYINVLKAFTKIRINEILAVTNEEYKKIIDSFLIDPDNENIFIFIYISII